MSKDENNISIYTYNEQGKVTGVLQIEVQIIQKSYSKDSLNSDKLELLAEAKKREYNYLYKSEQKNSEVTELASIANASSSEEYCENNSTSRAKILDSEDSNDCGTFKCMGKNNDFCCVIM